MPVGRLNEPFLGLHASGGTYDLRPQRSAVDLRAKGREKSRVRSEHAQPRLVLGDGLNEGEAFIQMSPTDDSAQIGVARCIPDNEDGLALGTVDYRSEDRSDSSLARLLEELDRPVEVVLVRECKVADARPGRLLKQRVDR